MSVWSVGPLYTRKVTIALCQFGQLTHYIQLITRKVTIGLCQFGQLTHYIQLITRKVTIAFADFTDVLIPDCVVEL